MSHIPIQPRQKGASRWRLALVGLGLVFMTIILMLTGPTTPPGAQEPLPAAPGIIALPIPYEVAGLPIQMHLVGPEADEEIARLHRGSFALTGAAIALYQNAEATVWVGGAESTAKTRLIVYQMTQSIARVDSPFTPVGQRRLRDLDVYELVGMGQAHFYFQVDDRVYWLAITPDRVDRGLQDLLDFALKTE